MELNHAPAVLGEFEDVNGNVWTAKLMMKAEPVVRLTCARSPGFSDYNLTQFLTVAGRVSRFRITGGELSDPVFTLPPGVANQIAQQALGRIQGCDGHYELRWVPADPRVPF